MPWAQLQFATRPGGLTKECDQSLVSSTALLRTANLGRRPEPTNKEAEQSNWQYTGLFMFHVYRVLHSASLTSSQGSLFFVIKRETSLEKTPIFSWFYKKLGLFYKNSILTIFTQPKAKMWESAPKNQIQTHIKSCCCNSRVVWSSKDHSCNFKNQWISHHKNAHF